MKRPTTPEERLRAAYGQDLLAMLGCLSTIAGLLVLAIFVGALI